MIVFKNIDFSFFFEKITGFATTARTTDACRKLEPTGIAAFHVADGNDFSILFKIISFFKKTFLFFLF